MSSCYAWAAQRIEPQQVQGRVISVAQKGREMLMGENVIGTFGRCQARTRPLPITPESFAERRHTLRVLCQESRHSELQALRMRVAL
jgi:hypothetical protein